MLNSKIIFFLTLLSISITSVKIYAQNEQDSIDTIIKVNVLDSERNNIVGLKKENFEVKDGNVVQDISILDNKTEGARIVILMDISSSISDLGRIAGGDAILRWLDSPNDPNDYSIISFGKGESILADWGSSKQELENAIKKMKSSNTQVKDTGVERGLSLAIDTLSKSKNHKKFIVFYTDWVYGGYSIEKLAEIKNSLQKSNIQLFQIVLQPPRKLGEKPPQIGDADGPFGMSFMVLQSDFEALSKLSAGKLYYPDSREVVFDVFERIKQFINNQYLISFQRLRTKSKKTKIKVKIKGIKDVQEIVVREAI